MVAIAARAKRHSDAGGVIIANRKVRNFAPGAEGLNGSFADFGIDPSA
jgi:peptide/nickel transport system substrate-binding protein